MTSPTVTQSQIQTALRSFILTVLPTWECIEGQDSRVSEPSTTDFVVMTIINRTRLETNGSFYTPPPGSQLVAGSETITQAFQVTFQLDFHSANVGDSSDAAVLVSTLFRDDVAVQAFAASGYPISPLYADDPKQIPFLNAEQQFETRWVLDAVLQVNAGVVWSQQFMLGAPGIQIQKPADGAPA